MARKYGLFRIPFRLRIISAALLVSVANGRGRRAAAGDLRRDGHAVGYGALAEANCRGCRRLDNRQGARLVAGAALN
jgi:hypothetical protein